MVAFGRKCGLADIVTNLTTVRLTRREALAVERDCGDSIHQLACAAKLLIPPGPLSPSVMAETARLAELTLASGLTLQKTKTESPDRLRGLASEFVHLANRINRYPN